MKRSEVIYTLLKIVTDGTAIFLAILSAYALRISFYEFDFLNRSFQLFPEPISSYPLLAFLYFTFLCTSFLLVVLAINGRYEIPKKEPFHREVASLFWSLSTGMALVLVYFFFTQFTFFSRLIFGLAWGIAFVYIIIGRLVLRALKQRLNRKGLGRTQVLLIGNHEKVTLSVIDHLKNDPEYGLVGIISSENLPSIDFEKKIITGHINQLRAILESNYINEVWLAAPHSEKLNHEIAKIAHSHHKTFRLFPDEIALDLAGLELSTFHDLPLVTLKNNNLNGWGLVLKNIFDLVSASLILVILSPVLITIALIIKLKNPKAPIIYKSKRVGLNGRIFDCYKFRTMVPNADELKQELIEQNERKGGILFKMADDPRITSFGKFLRKSSLDEFPQLFNILKRDMSFIGPRPHLVEEVQKYPEELKQVLSVRPGLSGFAQINGHSQLSFEEEMRYELFYLKNWSFSLDLLIFLKSFLVVLRSNNQ